jgi:hypothetical protein
VLLSLYLRQQEIRLRQIRSHDPNAPETTVTRVPELFLCPDDPDALRDRSFEELHALWGGVEKGGPWPKGLVSYAEPRAPRKLDTDEPFALLADRAAFHGAGGWLGFSCGRGLGNRVHVLFSDGRVERLHVPAGWTVETGGVPALEGLVFRPGR